MSEKKDEWGFVPFPDNYHPIVQPKTYTKADIIKLAEEVVLAEALSDKAPESGVVRIMAYSETDEAWKLYSEAFSIWYRAGKPE